MSAEVVRDASNALVVAAEAARTSATAFARMLSESEAEREKLTSALVRSEAAYAGSLAERESANQRVQKVISETLLLRELEEDLRQSLEILPQSRSVILFKLDELRKVR